MIWSILLTQRSMLQDLFTIGINGKTSGGWILLLPTVNQFQMMECCNSSSMKPRQRHYIYRLVSNIEQAICIFFDIGKVGRHHFLGIYSKNSKSALIFKFLNSENLDIDIKFTAISLLEHKIYLIFNIRDNRGGHFEIFLWPI